MCSEKSGWLKLREALMVHGPITLFVLLITSLFGISLPHSLPQQVAVGSTALRSGPVPESLSIHAYDASASAGISHSWQKPIYAYGGNAFTHSPTGPKPVPSLITALLPLLACRRPRPENTRNTTTIPHPNLPRNRAKQIYGLVTRASPAKRPKSHSYGPHSVLFWPSRDPIGERGGINLYGMVGNDAVNFKDYRGLKRLKMKFTIASKSEGEVDEEGNPNAKFFWKEYITHSFSATSDHYFAARTSIQAVAASIEAHVGENYSPDGEDPCNCVESLIIWTHGHKGSLIFGESSFSIDWESKLKAALERSIKFSIMRLKAEASGANAQDLDLAKNNEAATREKYDEINETVQSLEKIGGLMCKDSKVQFFACEAGDTKTPWNTTLQPFFPISKVGEMPWKGLIGPATNKNGYEDIPYPK